MQQSRHNIKKKGSVLYSVMSTLYKDIMDKKILLEKSEVILYVTVGFLSAIIFVSIYGLHVLNPFYTDWLLNGGDLTQHYLGWRAYRNSSWNFPIGMLDTLAYPNRTSIIFTDSIPIFAVLFKMAAPILPENFQYFGLWGIMCFILQGILASRILRNFTDNKFAIIVSSLIFVYTPVMIWRMYAHTSLAGQWVLLLGMEPIFAHTKYQNQSKKLYIITALMGILSASIHIYFILMSGILLAGQCLMNIIIDKKFKRSLSLLGTYMISTIITVWILGGFSSNMSAGAGGLGLFSMNINAFFNPQGWSCIFQNLSLYGEGQYEGFAYLGAGCILLCMLAVVEFFLGGSVGRNLKEHGKKLLILFFVVLISIIAALSPTITFGNNLIVKFPLPKIFFDVWSVFRASGRISWVAVYVIMIFCCIVLFKKLNKLTLCIAISIALILQIYDIHEILGGKNKQFNQIVINDSLLKDTEFWSFVEENEDIKHIVFATSIDENSMYAITDWAINNNKTVNTFYFARSMSDLVDESLHSALNELSTENLFIFARGSEMKACGYDMNYYQIDGLIVGYKNKIEGLTPLQQSGFYYVWNFGDNLYMGEGEGEDTEDGRILYADGLSYGPYWEVSSGNYKVSIAGEGLENANIIIYSQHGELYHDFQIEHSSDSEIDITLPLENDVSDLEIVIRNDSEDSIKIKSMELRYFQG